MIKTRKDLKEYLNADKIALGIKTRRPRFLRDLEWRYQILLRKTEYYVNTNSILRFFYMYKLRKTQIKYLTFIPINTCDKGLSIAHIGNIRINANSKIGKYCRIQTGTILGATGGSIKAPIVHDYVYIGAAAKIIGDINICSYTCIGAGSVVVKSINEAGTYAGVPAKKISENTSKNFLINFD